MSERLDGGDREVQDRVVAVANSLEGGTFDPQHTGAMFLRESAAKAVRESLQGTVDVVVQLDGKANLTGARFMGLRVAPDLAVYPFGGAPRPISSSQPLDLFDLQPRSPREDVSAGIAVTITILRQDARPVQSAIADAVILATRYAAVVVFVLDRRMGSRDAFGGLGEGDQRTLSTSDQRLIQELSREHRVRIVVCRQDPFGFA